MSTTNKTKIPALRPAPLGARSALSDRATPPPNRLRTPPMSSSRLPRWLQTHKPLPSPPMAQVMNPNSPPKAHRTLIDAYSVTPIGNDWSIIHPENVPPRLSSKRSSLPTSSNTTSTAPSPLEQDDEERSTRVKSLSWHSFSTGKSSGTGPILRISADADAVILGFGDSIPDVPSIPTVLPNPSHYPRSFGSRTGRMTKTTESRTSLSIVPASPTPSMSESMRNVSSPVKISPIRSMQPPRKPSLDAHSRKSPSPLATSFVDVESTVQGAATASDTHLNMPTISHNTPETTVSDSEPNSIALNLTVVPETSEQNAEAHQGRAEALPESAVVLKDKYSLNARKIRTTVAPFKNTAISRGSNAHARINSPDLDVHNADQSSLFLPHTPPSHDTVRNIDLNKLRVPETAVSNRVDSSLGRHTPSGRQSDQSGRQSHVSPVTTSSLLQDRSPDRQDRSSSKKVTAQRSLRGIFSRDKPRATTPETVPTKQGFMSATRSSLAKVMRDSKSRSKVHLAKMTESKPETESAHTMKKKHSTPMPLTAFKFAGTTASPPGQFVPDNREQTRTVILDMLDRMDEQPRDSPDRLRDMQIAECVVNAAESSHNANICAMQAKKNSRDAEIYANRMNLELMRVYGLLGDGGFDPESVKAIKSHICNIGLAGTTRGTYESTVSDRHGVR